MNERQISVQFYSLLQFVRVLSCLVCFPLGEICLSISDPIWMEIIYILIQGNSKLTIRSSAIIILPCRTRPVICKLLCIGLGIFSLSQSERTQTHRHTDRQTGRQTDSCIIEFFKNQHYLFLKDISENFIKWIYLTFLLLRYIKYLFALNLFFSKKA